MSSRPRSAPVWRKSRLGWVSSCNEALASGYPMAEAALIERHVTLARRDVVELGCGAGRLTFQYAARARSVHAIDANPDWIALARREARARRLANVRFSTGGAQRWRPRRASADVVLFSWSLC